MLELKEQIITYNKKRCYIIVVIMHVKIFSAIDKQEKSDSLTG
jgi:hypothetical protein